MKPIIGITVDSKPDPSNDRTKGKLELNWNYAEAVSDAGGVPILVPPTADMHVVATIIDGWLIPGGNDIDASNWGEANHATVVPIEKERFNAERSLMAHIPAEMPVFGICYGCQFINVARGGSLIQHLPDEGHENHTGGTMQAYDLDPQSKLASAARTARVEGKSYHHQAVKSVGEGLRIVAKDSQGLVEAIEATDRPWMIGVQWHPERTQEDAATQELFRSFISACGEYAARKRA